MNHQTLLLASIALFAGAWPCAAAPSPDEQAKFLAGMKVKDPGLSALAKSSDWTAHAATLQKKWASMETRQLAPARKWAGINLALTRADTVFYPFSGPDFVYAYTFFPRASTYILCGTEPVGSVPDISQMAANQVSADLDNLRTALDTMLTTHYFITKDMRVDLTRGSIHGTLPLLYVFLARTGCTIGNVKVNPSSVEISFSGKGFKSKTLSYFKTDLSNGGGNSQFFSFCKQHAPGATLVKSASYLMHGDGFSTVRNFLLANSSVIIEDDSGIPYRFFNSDRWNVKLYGNYSGPTDLFRSYRQADLAAAYGGGSAPLGFAFGYSWQVSKGMLIQAPRK
jgi:hypothetical protein